MEDLEEVANLGIDRMVIGSAAVTNPEFVADAVSVYGDRIAVGLDARNGMLATHGWKEQSAVSALDAGMRFAEMGVKHIIFTDIGRDGKLEGPNISALVDMTQAIKASVIASGGVSSLNDLQAIKRTRATGVIVGAALYHNRLSLKDAITIGKGGTA